nr:MAG TPA: hypothetical protein [Caudoviricetes sp.]
MVINMTELPIMSWSPGQFEAARKLCTDGIIRAYSLPTILPQDNTIYVTGMALETEQNIMHQFGTDNIDAIIVQGEPIFVYAFVNACKGELKKINCYSPCYDSDGKFVKFRRF